MAKRVLRFLRSQKGGVLSTAAKDEPHGAFVYYVADDDFSIYFTTPVVSGKYRNLSDNKKAAFTVASVAPPRTVQIEGIVEIVKDQETVNAFTARYISLAVGETEYPVPITKLKWQEGVVIYKIKPTQIHWSDFAANKEPGLDLRISTH